MSSNSGDSFEMANTYLDAFLENLSKQIEVGGIRDDMLGLYLQVAQVYAIMGLAEKMSEYIDKIS